MGVDYYFRTGSTHAICQDYALAGESGGIQYTILSDGCSGTPVAGDPGSPHTDFGSRFLVHSTRRHLKEMTEGVFPGDAIITEAHGMNRQACLSLDALYATMIATVRRVDSPYTRVFQTGDGVVASRFRNGEIHYTTVHFEGNAPHYLVYAVDPRTHDAYLRQFQQVHIVSRIYRPGTGWSEPMETVETIDPHMFHRSYIYSAEHTDLVLTMSDGAESFVKKKAANEPIPLETVLEHLFAIKNYEGVFLTRRCNRFLNDFCAKQGWHHTDDLAVTGQYLEAP